MVFASKSACFKCGEPKPSGGGYGGGRGGGDRYDDRRGGDRYDDRRGRDYSPERDRRRDRNGKSMREYSPERKPHKPSLGSQCVSQPPPFSCASEALRICPSDRACACRHCHRYDSIFEGADWYDGLTPAADEQPTSSVPASAAPAAATSDDIATQKKRMLDEFLGSMASGNMASGSMASGNGAPAPVATSTAAPVAAAPATAVPPPVPAAPAPTAASLPAATGGDVCSSSAAGGASVASPASPAPSGVTSPAPSPSASPGARLVKSFMSELSELASIVQKTTSEVIADSVRSQELECSFDAPRVSAAGRVATGAPAAAALVAGAPTVAATAAAAKYPLSSPTDPSRPFKRLRLHEMRVRHVLSCLRRLGLQQHCAAFEACKVDGGMCDLMDEELLRHQIGMSDPSHRKLWLQWVSSMQPPAGCSRPPAPPSRT